jgi:hypothetical protein
VPPGSPAQLDLWDAGERQPDRYTSWGHLPIYEVERDLALAAEALNSCDRLDHGKVRGFIRFLSKWWICNGSGGGSTLHRAYTLEEWHAQIPPRRAVTDYWEQVEHYTENERAQRAGEPEPYPGLYRGSCDGLVFTWNRHTWVLGGAPGEHIIIQTSGNFTAAFEQRLAELRGRPLPPNEPIGAALLTDQEERRIHSAMWAEWDRIKERAKRQMLRDQPT